MIRVVTAFVLAALSLQQPSRDAARAMSRTGAIRGRVLTAAGEPLRKARVALTSEGRDDGAPVYADGDGRFMFTNLSPGRYVLTASKAGYVTTRLGASHPLEPPTPITIPDGGGAVDVEIRLARGAAISGRVLDDNGDPVIAAPVAAARVIHAGARVTLTTVKASTTDDLGDYRLPELAAGSYIVTVDPSDSMSAMRTAGVMIGPTGRVIAGDEPWTHWRRAYYPSAASLGQAQALPLQTGQELTGIDFAVRPTATAQVSISAAGADGSPADGSVVITSDSPLDPDRHAGSFSPEGPAVVPLEPGEWDVFADGGDAGSAISHLSVGESNIALSLTLRKKVRVSGRVLVNGAVPVSRQDLAIEALPHVLAGGDARAVSAFVISRLRRPARVGADGSFTLSVDQGPVDLRFVNLPTGWSVQFVSIGTRRMPEPAIDVSGTDDIANVVIEISTRQTLVSGVVESSPGTSSRSSVIVFPADPALLSDPDRWA
ncbi:MAG: carboxypeptidase-like regulatory domain-containing protein, partial [Vicinamibacterales bacterium]